MPTAAEQMFLALLRSELTGESPLSVVPDEELLTVAARHDLSHLVADALDKAGALGGDELSAKFKKARYMAVYRYEQIRYELETITTCLKAANIPFLPLKGAVMREYYPEPWMRTSCDIDVLVHPEDAERATQVLCETPGYRCEGTGTHDISLFSPGGLHVELHFDTVEEGRAVRAKEVLASVWDHSTGDGCFRMSDAMFYFYHIAHMAKHIETGGCGVRSLIDLWLLERIDTADREARQTLLQAGGLERFAEAAVKLAEHWFSGAEADGVVLALELFVLHGGVFGTVATNTAVQQHRQGGRWVQMRAVLLPPYHSLKLQYPILQEKAWLYPVCLVYRLGGKVFGRDRQRAARKLRQMAAVGKKEREDAGELLVNLGLSD